MQKNKEQEQQDSEKSGVRGATLFVAKNSPANTDTVSTRKLVFDLRYKKLMFVCGNDRDSCPAITWIAPVQQGTKPWCGNV